MVLLGLAPVYYGLLELSWGRARAIYHAAMLYSGHFMSLSISISSPSCCCCCCLYHRLRFGHFRSKCCCFHTILGLFSFFDQKINISILKGNLAKSSTGLLSSGSFPVPPGPTPCCFCCCFLSALLYDYLLHNNKRKMNQKMSELVEREKGAKSQWNIEKFIGNKANRVFKLLIWECFPKQKNMH